jgi:hypothetical protein
LLCPFKTWQKSKRRINVLIFFIVCVLVLPTLIRFQHPDQAPKSAACITNILHKKRKPKAHLKREPTNSYRIQSAIKWIKERQMEQFGHKKTPFGVFLIF